MTFLAYYLMVAPHVTADGDSGELTLVLVTGGVAHPTGYPLYTMLGHTFVLLLRALGVGYAFAANAWAALGGAVALFFLHRVALRLVPGRPGISTGARFAIAAIPVLALAFNPRWIAECVLVEVNSWHVAWLCGATLLFTGTVQELDDRDRPTAPARRMLWWGFVCGVGGAHHSTAIFPAAVFTAALTWSLARAQWLRPQVPLLWLAGGLIPMLSYAYVYLRALHPGAATIWPGLEPTLKGVYEHVSGNIYRGFVGTWHPDPDQAQGLAHDVYPFLASGLAALAVWFAVAPTVVDRIVITGLVGAALVQLVFAYHYGVSDPLSYFLSPLAISLLGFAGLGYAMVARGRTGLALAGALGVAITALLAVWGTRAALELRRDVVRYDDAIRSMWHAVPDERSIFLWASDSYYKVRLYQQLEGDRSAVDVYNTAMLCQTGPEERFRRKYGFDPLANNGPEHAREYLEPRFIPEHHLLLDDRFLGRVNKTIADSARVPVLMFNGAEMRLRRLN